MTNGNPQPQQQMQPQQQPPQTKEDVMLGTITEAFEVLLNFIDNATIENNKIKQDQVDDLQGTLASLLHIKTNQLKAVDEDNWNKPKNINHLSTNEKEQFCQMAIDEGLSTAPVNYYEAKEVYEKHEKAADIGRKGRTRLSRLDFIIGKCCFPEKHAGTVPRVEKKGKNTPVACSEHQYIFDNRDTAYSLFNRFRGKLRALRTKEIPLKELSIKEKFLIIKHRYISKLEHSGEEVSEDMTIEKQPNNYMTMQENKDITKQPAILVCKKCGNSLNPDEYKADTCKWCGAKNPSKATMGDRMLNTFGKVTKGIGTMTGMGVMATNQVAQSAGQVGMARQNMARSGSRIQQNYNNPQQANQQQMQPQPQQPQMQQQQNPQYNNPYRQQQKKKDNKIIMRRTG